MPSSCQSAGVLPPFGHPLNIPVIVDKALGSFRSSSINLVGSAVDEALRSAPSQMPSPGFLDESTRGVAEGSVGCSRPPCRGDIAANYAERNQHVLGSTGGSGGSEGSGGSGVLCAIPSITEGGAGSGALLHADDPSVLFCGAGIAYASVCVTFDQLMALTGGRSADISCQGPQESRGDAVHRPGDSGETTGGDSEDFPAGQELESHQVMERKEVGVDILNDITKGPPLVDPGQVIMITDADDNEIMFDTVFSMHGLPEEQELRSPCLLLLANR